MGGSGAQSQHTSLTLFVEGTIGEKLRSCVARVCQIDAAVLRRCSDSRAVTKATRTMVVTRGRMTGAAGSRRGGGALLRPANNATCRWSTRASCIGRGSPPSGL